MDGFVLAVDDFLRKIGYGWAMRYSGKRFIFQLSMLRHGLAVVAGEEDVRFGFTVISDSGDFSLIKSMKSVHKVAIREVPNEGRTWFFVWMGLSFVAQ